MEKTRSFSIYFCPLQEKWREQPPLGDIFSKISYFNSQWGIPHMTLTSFSPLDSIDKISEDIQKILNSLGPFDISQYFNETYITETISLYILKFKKKIHFLSSFLEELKILGYQIKSEKIHITLGEVEEIDTIEEIKKEVASTIKEKKVSQKIFEYFSNLQWTISIVTLSDFPAKIEKQFKITK